MSKVVASRDTKLDSRRELTNSNLSAVRAFQRKKSADSHLKLDNHRISLDRKSGQAFSDHETFTKSHTPNFHSQKIVDRSILRVKKLDWLRTVSTGESPLGKRGSKFYSREARVMFERFPILGVASQFYLKTNMPAFLLLSL